MRFFPSSFLPAVALAALAGFAASTPASAETTALSDEADGFYQGFVDPPADYRPGAWWIWWGNRLEVSELLRELRAMDEAGYGGFNIEMNALLDWWKPTDEPVDSPYYEWVSDEWFDVLERVVDEAHERGMFVDTLANTGWALGGRFVEEGDAAQRLYTKRIELTGPQTFEKPLDTVLRWSPRKGNEVVFARLVPRHPVAFTPGKELMPEAVDGGRLSVKAPEGEWDLYVGIRVQPSVSVHAGIGRDKSPAVDIHDPDAVRRYLEKVEAEFVDRFGAPLGDTFRAFESESVEFAGANWTDDMRREFRERRGYALEPYLPFVCIWAGGSGYMKNPDKLPSSFRADTDFGRTVRRARYDFYRTLVELGQEGFYETMAEWCREQELVFRMQTSGTPFTYDAITLGTIASSPEPEAWIWNKWHPDIRVERNSASNNKLAASGAQIAGTDRVSSETFTNTDGVYLTTLDYIKRTDDLNTIAGVNHTFTHVFPHTESDALFPDGFWYGDFSEDQPWWPYFRNWTDYNARVAWATGNGGYEAQVAILAGMARQWRDRPKFSPREPLYMMPLWRAFAAQGAGVNFVNETLLRRAAPQGERLKLGEQTYQLLVIPELDMLETATVETLTAFAEAGGRIAFIDRVPSRVPGLHEAEERDAEVKRKVRRMLDKFPERVRRIDGPRNPKRVVGYAGRLLEKFDVDHPVEIAEPDPLLMQTRYVVGDRQIVFFANVDPDAGKAKTVSFAETDKPLWVWDPETGERYRHPSPDNRDVPLRLAPSESRLFVLDPDSPRDAPVYPVDEPASFTRTIEGPWDVCFDPVNGEAFDRPFGKLADLAKTNPERLNTFAGNAIYETTFEVDDPEAYSKLSLGEVAAAAEVRLNGRHLGMRWWGDFEFDVPDALETGGNTLKVKVATPIWNAVRVIEDHPIVNHHISRHPPYVPGHGREPITAGLIGPVRLGGGP